MTHDQTPMMHQPPRPAYLPARKNGPGGQLVGWLMRWSMRRHFRHVLARYRGDRGVLDPALPLIYLTSHVAWWDGYLMYLVNRRLFAPRDGYLMMEERQLARYGFFRWVGCFSVDRDHPRRALASLHYAADLLTAAPNRALVLFPQGVIVPNDRRPLHLETGVARLVRRLGRALVVPVALRYEFLGEQHPTAFASAGTPLLVQASQTRAVTTFMALLTEQLTAEMDGLRAAVVDDATHDFTPLLAGSRSVNEAFDRARHWALGRRARPTYRP
jgi:hypothetical protein